jgi:hypothetical protein
MIKDIGIILFMVLLVLSVIFFSSYIVLPSNWITAIGLPEIELNIVTLILTPLVGISAFIIVGSKQIEQKNETN